jgi:hypothetical protein
MRHEFRVVQGSPVPKNIAPYIALITDEAHAKVQSIYRGDDARSILNAHGKHSQRQLYDGWNKRRPGYAPANPPGYSTHEQKSDGVAYKTPRGRDLAWWQVGFDVNDSDVKRVIAAAKRHGWTVTQPYKSGSEYHHLNFAKQPRPKTPAMLARIRRLRDKQLPRR